MMFCTHTGQHQTCRVKEALVTMVTCSSSIANMLHTHDCAAAENNHLQHSTTTVVLVSAGETININNAAQGCDAHYRVN